MTENCTGLSKKRDHIDLYNCRFQGWLAWGTAGFRTERCSEDPVSGLDRPLLRAVSPLLSFAWWKGNEYNLPSSSVVGKYEWLFLLGLSSPSINFWLVWCRSHVYPELINVAKIWSWLRPRCWDTSFSPGVRSGEPHMCHDMKIKGSIVSPGGQNTSNSYREDIPVRNFLVGKKSKSVFATGKR